MAHQTKSFRPSPTALLNPRCDASFKAMFTQETKESHAALQDFISVLLGRDVAEITLLPNEPPIDMADENQMSFDVSVKFDDGERVDLEMQSRNEDYDYAARAEIQVARLLNVNNKKGDRWTSPAAYQISVLNFEFDKDDMSALSWYTMRKENGGTLAGKLNVLFFDLIKIHRLLGTPPEKLTRLQKWGLFLSYADDERYANYIDTLTKTEEGIMNAKSALCEVSMDEINWVRENSIFKAQRDYNEGMYRAEERGIKQGAHDKAVESARRFLRMGLSIEQIAEGVGLSVEEIKQLQ